jgi:nucleotide-binding universal stress UspA family protein
MTGSGYQYCEGGKGAQNSAQSIKKARGMYQRHLKERRQMKILIPVEDSLYGSLVVNFLAQHEWPEDTSFRVVTVVEPYFLDRDSKVDFAEFLSSTDRLILSSANRIVEEVAGYIKEAFPNAAVTSDVFKGHVTEVLVAQARDWNADLIVAGTHGRGGFNRFFLGSTSLALLNEAPCPTLLVKPDEKMLAAWEHINLDEIPTDTIQKYFSQPCNNKSASRILIAVDETELSLQMIDFVTKQRWTQPARFKLLTCLRQPGWLGRLPLPGMADAYQQLKKDRTCRLRTQALMLRDFYHSPHIEEELVEGDPKRVILDKAVAWGADLIIVGCHLRGPAQRMAVGSVGMAVLCAAPCNTLLLRQETSDSSYLKTKTVANEMYANICQP